MSDLQTIYPTTEEFVNKKKQHYHDESIRLRTLAEASKDSTYVLNAASFWSWIGGIYDEIEALYTVLDLMMGTDKFAMHLSKTMLGFPEKPTSVEEIKIKAKEFGDFSTILFKKKKEWELETEEKEKYK